MPPPPAALSVADLSFTYEKAAHEALRGVSLELPAGCRGLLLGPTGAGKSTLVRCLNGTIPRFHPGRLDGTIVVDGRPIRGLRVPEAALHAAVVFQEFETQIFSTSCLLEVAFAMESRCLPPDLIVTRAKELLARVGLAGFEERDPATLSGGEKQRLVIAAVLALEAPLLVLDEPASDLDPEGRQRVYGTLSAVAGESVLVVEHDLEGVPASGPATVLIDGRRAGGWEEGSPRALAEASAGLRRAGVRPQPMAEVAAVLASRHGRVVPLDSLDVAAVHGALVRDGWRLAPGVTRPARRSRPVAPLLRCKGLTHRYPGPGADRPALDRIDLTIGDGEMVAILGANGSGKTTLARILCGIDRPSGGSVLLGDRPPGSIPGRERVRRLGYVFQNPDLQISAPTVREEVSFGPLNAGCAPAEAGRLIDSALAAVGLSDLEGEDPFALTRGERQRVALASVIACEPSLLVLDEPTTGLDLNEQARMMDLLARLNAGGHTIVIVTHALWLVSDPIGRAIVMKTGRVVADGLPEEILANEPLMIGTGLRVPDLLRFARLWDAPFVEANDWADLLRPPAGPAGP